jgi:hypothetical protein
MNLQIMANLQLVLFLLVLTGVYAGKRNIITANTRKHFIRPAHRGHIAMQHRFLI